MWDEQGIVSRELSVTVSLPVKKLAALRQITARNFVRVSKDMVNTPLFLTLALLVSRME